MLHDPATLTVLGIKLYHVAAGLAGGMVRAIVRPGTSLWQGLGACVVGALTAAYITPVAAPWAQDYFGSEAVGIEGATGFVLGLAGMAFCEGILRYARQRLTGWRPPEEQP